MASTPPKHQSPAQATWAKHQTMMLENSTCGLPTWTSEWKRQYEGEPGNFPSEDPGNRMNRMQVPSKHYVGLSYRQVRAAPSVSRPCGNTSTKMPISGDRYKTTPRVVSGSIRVWTAKRAAFSKAVFWFHSSPFWFHRSHQPIFLAQSESIRTHPAQPPRLRLAA